MTNYSILTPMEIRILQAASEGLSIKSTAMLLNMAAPTVKTHRSAINIKLHAKNVTHAVAIGFRMGLLSTGLEVSGAT